MIFISRTIHFYNVFLTFNGEKTNHSLTTLIDNIFNLEDHEKFWREKKLSILFRKLIDINNPLNYNNRSFAVAKYRDDYRPYTGRIGTNEALPIESDIIEFTCCCYIESTRQLIVEYNHHGSRPNDIAKYLSSFLPNTEDGTWQVCMEPIDSNKGLNTLRSAEKINSIEFKLDCHQELKSTYANSFFGNFFKRTIESHVEFGANVATVKFSNGMKRLDIIDAHSLIQLITLLDFEDELFHSVKIEFIDSQNKRDIIDLKNGRILKAIIMEDVEATGYEFIIDQIESYYDRNQGPGSNGFLRFNRLVRNLNYPVVIPHINIFEDAAPEQGA